MAKVKEYHLKPTPLIPNSPYPLLHYPGILSSRLSEQSHIAPKVHTLFKSNGWNTQWIFRYGATQQSHYHSKSPECMAVLSGTATIRFGAADLTTDLKESTWEGAHEGGIEVIAKAGDVFLIPAGVAHKTFDTSPAREFALLTPGEGRGIVAGDGDVEKALGEIKLEGYTMMGAYPENGEWDFATGGEDAGGYESVWGILKPERDPVLGVSEEGLRGLWKEVDMTGFEKGGKRGDKSFDVSRNKFGVVEDVKAKL